mmetsp:Transcript_24631/g.66990  ORF Transcript_24631/g.66990 Transcript_24631/m.66990 type:complete len:386 (+) Transcript_24631:1586-2743(+)
MPPLPPALARIAGGDGDVADGRVEPHVEDLVLHALEGHGHTPLEVARDAPRLQAPLDPCLRRRDGVVCPEAVHGRLVNPLNERLCECRQIEVHVVRGPRHGRGARRRAPRVDELRGVEQLAALVALVAARVVVATVRAGARDESVSEELTERFRVELLCGLLEEETALVAVHEDGLRDLRLVGRGCAPEVVELDVEPLVHLRVDGVVLVADLLGGEAFRQRLDLGGGAVLVRAAHVDHVGATLAHVARVHIRREHAPDDVAQVRHVVHVGQRRRDEDVTCTAPRQPHARRRRGPGLARSRGGEARGGGGARGGGHSELARLEPKADLPLGRLVVGGHVHEIAISCVREVAADRTRFRRLWVLGTGEGQGRAHGARALPHRGHHGS